MRIKGLWTAALTVWLVPVMSAVLSGGLAAQTPGPRMPLAGLEKLAAAASETVDVSLDTSLLALAARFMDDGDAEDAQVKAMMSGLKGVYVRSYEFGADGAFGPADVEIDPPAAVGARLVADGRRPQQEGQRRRRRLSVARRLEDRRARHPRHRAAALHRRQHRRRHRPRSAPPPRRPRPAQARSGTGKDKAAKDKAKDKPKPTRHPGPCDRFAAPG